EQLRVAHVDPAALDADPVAGLEADADLRLEEHPAAEVDLAVRRILVILGRTRVHGDPEARPDVEPVAELRRQADRGVIGLARAVQRAEDVGLERGVADIAATPAEHDVGAALDAALVERGLDVMDIESAERLASNCWGSRRGESGTGEDARDFHGASMRDEALGSLAQPAACHAAIDWFGH